MDILAKVEALKGMFQARITPESSPEEIESTNKANLELDEIVTAYNDVVKENAKFKDTIVRMVTSQGSSDKPVDDSQGSKPKSIEECIAEELNKEKEK